MATRIIYDGILLANEATHTTTKDSWSGIEGVLPPSGSTSVNPEDYIFIFNDVEYQCNYFLKGDTKYKAAYRTENHDTISLEYVIATGLSLITVRHDEITVLDSNTFKLIERIPEKPAKAIVRFNNDKAFIIDNEGNVEGV